MAEAFFGWLDGLAESLAQSCGDLCHRVRAVQFSPSEAAYLIEAESSGRQGVEERVEEFFQAMRCGPGTQYYN
jgi:hypothetical protein